MMQLEAELADVRDAQREHGRAADVDPASAEEPEALVRELVRRDALGGAELEVIATRAAHAVALPGCASSRGTARGTTAGF